MSAHPLIERESARDWALQQARDYFIRDELSLAELETAIDRIFRDVRGWWRDLGPWRPA